MAVDSRWRLYYNDAWVASHTVEENAAVLIHEVSHLLREHDARKQATAVRDVQLWNTATDCEINDDLIAEGLPLPDDPPLPGKFGLLPGENAETYYRQLLKPAGRGLTPPHSFKPARIRPVRMIADLAHTANRDRGNCPVTMGVRAECREWIESRGARAPRGRAAHPRPIGRRR